MIDIRLQIKQKLYIGLNSRNKTSIVLILLLSLINIKGISQTNSDLLQYKEFVNKDSIANNISYLESFGSRYAFNPNNRTIALWLRDKLQSYGFDSRLDSFYIDNFVFPYNSDIVNNSWQYNIIADKLGIYSEDTAIILGAHYDSYGNRDTNYFLSSPGADDNASGVAAILEIARLYQELNLKPIKTLRIELYALEEAGLRGSYHAVTQALLGQMHIGTMINLDMIGYNDSLNLNTFSIIEYSNSTEIADLAMSVVSNYTDLTPYRTFEKNQNSDSYSYNSWGGKAVFLHEGGEYPFYHTSEDNLNKLDLDYLRKTTQIAFALIYHCVNTNDYYPIGIKDIDKKKIEFRLKNNPIKESIDFYYNGKVNNSDYIIIRDSFSRIVLKDKLKKYSIGGGNYSIESLNLGDGLFVISIGELNKKFIYLKK